MDTMNSASAARNRTGSGGATVDIFRRRPLPGGMAYASSTPRGDRVAFF